MTRVNSDNQDKPAPQTLLPKHNQPDKMPSCGNTLVPDFPNIQKTAKNILESLVITLYSHSKDSS